ncbi:hypothetical protein IV203_015858 [Nitzschia inconspicua]|uniref:Uncharacterized protein n=1 Tax=Nitzschia inconspicua TaxID=303405 RepID=A0A9K3LBJ3_9STRA|nr:hypothetical protein IV203_015858 [Nitzschia inconspicua]
MVRQYSYKLSTTDLSVLTASTEATDASAYRNCARDDENDNDGDCSVISSLSDTFTGSSRAVDRKVSFGYVEVREYSRIPGDHPETAIGVPLAIDWAFKPKPILSVDRFDKERRSCSKPVRLGAITRKKLLMEEFQIPIWEIRMAEKACEKYRKQLKAMKEKADQGELIEANKPRKFLRGWNKGIMKRCGLKPKVVQPTPLAVTCT